MLLEDDCKERISIPVKEEERCMIRCEMVRIESCWNHTVK